MRDLPEPEAWFKDKDFTADWLSPKLPYWFLILSRFRERKINVLDIGAFEGRSAVAFLEFLSESRVTSVDLFDTAETEDRFDRNVAPYGERIRKIKGDALSAMAMLAGEGRTFRIIYLDAAKGRDECFAHSAAAWRLLKDQGILIWDDLNWRKDLDDAERPHSAIKLFCQALSSCMTVLHNDRQMIVRKDRPWPASPAIG